MEPGFQIGAKVENGKLVAIDYIMQEELLLNSVEGEIVILEVKKSTNKNWRTLLQNNSIHLYCDKLAKAFNDGGYDMRAVFAKMSEQFFISWSMILVKQSMWHKIQKAMFDIDSTTKLDTKQVSEVYEHINRFTAEEFSISVPFPDRHSQSMEDYK